MWIFFESAIKSSVVSCLRRVQLGPDPYPLVPPCAGGEGALGGSGEVRMRNVASL